MAAEKRNCSDIHRIGIRHETAAEAKVSKTGLQKLAHVLLVALLLYVAVTGGG